MTLALLTADPFAGTLLLLAGIWLAAFGFAIMVYPVTSTAGRSNEDERDVFVL